VKVYYNQRR